ncbi:hypothetical protein ACFVH6_14265 [Spirillospora sp. NPDC127200]
MSQTPQDPAGTTHQFEAFQKQGPAQPEKTGGMNTGLIVGLVAVVAVVAIAAVALMMV